MLSLEPFTDHLVEVAPRSHGDASRDETSWQRERLLLTSWPRERPWEIEGEVIGRLGPHVS